MSRYLVTGFNSETGAIFRAEERDREGAEHCASSWVETQPLASHVNVLVVPDDYYCPPGSIRTGLTIVTTYRRVTGGVECLS